MGIISSRKVIFLQMTRIFLGKNILRRIISFCYLGSPPKYSDKKGHHNRTEMKKKKMNIKQGTEQLETVAAV